MHRAPLREPLSYFRQSRRVNPSQPCSSLQCLSGSVSLSGKLPKEVHPQKDSLGHGYSAGFGSTSLSNSWERRGCENPGRVKGAAGGTHPGWCGQEEVLTGNCICVIRKRLPSCSSLQGGKRNSDSAVEKSGITLTGGGQ